METTFVEAPPGGWTNSARPPADASPDPLASPTTGPLESTGRRDEPCDLIERLVGNRLGNYSIQAFLGKGGMAWVFLCQHNTLHRPCALKVLCPLLHDRDAGFLELFIAEARAAASLVHPHVVAVHNIGSADSLHFIELEYVDGVSLLSVLQRDGVLTPVTALGYLTQACEALGEAHRQGVVHRDFKPANVLVGSTGHAKLADFGLAKRVERTGGDELGGLTGTPCFMAPELFEGGPATPRSDVYAVGVSLYCLLSGTFPFYSDDVAELSDLHRRAAIPDLRQHRAVPESLVNLVQRCLAKSPGDRPPDGETLCGEMRRLQREYRSLEELVREALADTDWQWRAESNRFRIVVPTGAGRTQTVLVEEGLEVGSSQRLIRILSVCGPEDQSYWRRALALNAHISFGSLAVQEIDGRPCFVMLASYPRGTCDPEEIRHSVHDIGVNADAIERTLTGRDVY